MRGNAQDTAPVECRWRSWTGTAWHTSRLCGSCTGTRAPIVIQAVQLPQLPVVLGKGYPSQVAEPVKGDQRRQHSRAASVRSTVFFHPELLQAGRQVRGLQDCEAVVPVAEGQVSQAAERCQPRMLGVCGCPSQAQAMEGGQRRCRARQR